MTGFGLLQAKFESLENGEIEFSEVEISKSPLWKQLSFNLRRTESHEKADVFSGLSEAIIRKGVKP